MTSTILTMANGRGIDLLNPKVTDIDFVVIGEHLAKDNRYCGATKGIVYSVAEHTVRGVQAIIAATGDRTVAAYFACHDMPEGYLGDDTTPKKRAIGAVAQENFGALAAQITKTFDLLTERFDIVIHEAAGLPWPPTVSQINQVKHWDRVMLATEWRDLMRCPPPMDFGVEPLLEEIVPEINWQRASSAFRYTCELLLPRYWMHQEMIRARDLP